MSLREVLHLTHDVKKDDEMFDAHLCAALISIIIQLSDICEDEDINLDHVHSFEY